MFKYVWNDLVLQIYLSTVNFMKSEYRPSIFYEKLST